MKQPYSGPSWRDVAAVASDLEAAHKCRLRYQVTAIGGGDEEAASLVVWLDAYRAKPSGGYQRVWRQVASFPQVGSKTFESLCFRLLHEFDAEMLGPSIMLSEA